MRGQLHHGLVASSSALGWHSAPATLALKWQSTRPRQHVLGGSGAPKAPHVARPSAQQHQHQVEWQADYSGHQFNTSSQCSAARARTPAALRKDKETASAADDHAPHMSSSTTKGTRSRKPTITSRMASANATTAPLSHPLQDLHYMCYVHGYKVSCRRLQLSNRTCKRDRKHKRRGRSSGSGRCRSKHKRMRRGRCSRCSRCSRCARSACSSNCSNTGKATHVHNNAVACSSKLVEKQLKSGEKREWIELGRLTREQVHAILEELWPVVEWMLSANAPRTDDTLAFTQALRDSGLAIADVMELMKTAVQGMQYNEMRLLPVAEPGRVYMFRLATTAEIQAGEHWRGIGWVAGKQVGIAVSTVVRRISSACGKASSSTSGVDAYSCSSGNGSCSSSSSSDGSYSSSCIDGTSSCGSGGTSSDIDGTTGGGGGGGGSSSSSSSSEQGRHGSWKVGCCERLPDERMADHMRCAHGKDDLNSADIHDSWGFLETRLPYMAERLIHIVLELVGIPRKGMPCTLHDIEHTEWFDGDPAIIRGAMVFFVQLVNEFVEILNVDDEFVDMLNFAPA